MSWIIVRVRSDRKVERSIRETMAHLNLTRVNHAVVVPDREQYAGMLQKAKDYVTWGEATPRTVATMLRERGRLMGDHPVTDEAVAAETDYASIDAFAVALCSGEATIKDMPPLKCVFRLHPPRGAAGWGGIKRAFNNGGALGPRGEAIDKLVARMI